MSQQWVKVFSSEVPYIVEIAQAILHQNDIESVILNKKDTVQTHLYNGEVELYVLNVKVILAKDRLSKMEIWVIY